ncbi:alpha/beta fold hydrolase [Pseudomonas sp. LP_7_YM]|uniref:alpha/beta fold hydrolase n=1 Tax=Pseudomonas sp. LP_7_YM TaxID=2485137 RepID=UPI001061BB6A|nr:alpha/beta hydrolase [Pseudomonas sp. LP_7_YM]TDV65757.1 pimeloyl-ACP methyl ester carboxylesterase [Pseudomonas sp. LP_7_YM]
MADLILLHGGNHGSWCWAPLLEELAKEPARFQRIITLDMPGCGSKRGRDNSQLNLATVVKELNDGLRTADVKQSILLGHSIAGALVPMMAVEDPSLYSQLIYLATSLPAEGQSIMQLLGTGLHGEDPEHVGYPIDPLASTPQALSAAMFGQDLSEVQLSWLLSEVAQDSTPPAVALEPVTRAGYQGLMPATYILTQRDNILPPLWQRRFAERAGAARIIEIDTPHEPFVSHPALLAEVLRRLS